MKSTFNIYGYLAVIPHIQNVYPPRKEIGRWYFGFKYKSQVFEFFYYETLQEARNKYKKLEKAIEDYYLARENQ